MRGIKAAPTTEEAAGSVRDAAAGLQPAAGGGRAGNAYGGGGAPRRRPGAGPLWIMIAIFAAPVIAAWFFYLNPDYLPSGRTNRGDLIEPVVPFPPEIRLTTPAGEAFDPAVFEGKWTLTYLAGAACRQPCMKRLVDIRQIRLALGESSLNIGRLALLADSGANKVAGRIERGLEGMHVAVTDTAGGRRLLALLGEGEAAIGRIYIIDPMGNLMMRYARDAPAEDILQDMGRLMKASKNWIKGAQYGHN